MNDAIATAIISAASGFLGALLVFYIGRKNAKTQYADVLAKRISSLEERVDKLESHKRVLTNYATRLRKHIEEGKPPPPEDWPEY